MMETFNDSNDSIKEYTDKEKYTYLMATNLKVLRAKAGMTQYDLSKAAGISRQTIVQAETADKLSWGTYLSLVFVFSTNAETSQLMKLLGIYPENFQITDYIEKGE